MERLTQKSPVTDMVWFIDHEKNDTFLDPCEMNPHHNRLAIQKLNEYERAEEQGLLLKLPCKVGAELFAVLNKCRAMVVSEEDCDDELSCLECPYKKQFIVTQVSATKDVLMDEYFSKVPTYIWGKTLFATKEEAENALVELGKKTEC